MDQQRTLTNEKSQYIPNIYKNCSSLFVNLLCKVQGEFTAQPGRVWKAEQWGLTWKKTNIHPVRSSCWESCMMYAGGGKQWSELHCCIILLRPPVEELSVSQPDPASQTDEKSRPVEWIVLPLCQNVVAAVERRQAICMGASSAHFLGRLYNWVEP